MRVKRNVSRRGWNNLMNSKVCLRREFALKNLKGKIKCLDENV